MSLNKEACAEIYLFSRIMCVDGISFNNCSLPVLKNNKKIKNLIKSNNIYSNIVLSLLVYNIANSTRGISFKTYQVGV